MLLPTLWPMKPWTSPIGVVHGVTGDWLVRSASPSFLVASWRDPTCCMYLTLFVLSVSNNMFVSPCECVRNQNGHTGKATKASIHRNVVFVISPRGSYPSGNLQIMYVWWHVDPIYTVWREWLEHQVLIVLTIFFCLFFQIAPQSRRAVKKKRKKSL